MSNKYESAAIRTFKKNFPTVALAMEQQGWKLEMSRKGHIKAISPNGKMVYGSGTPRARQWGDKFIGDCRRAGLRPDDIMVRTYKAPPEIPLPPETVAATAKRGVTVFGPSVAASDEYWTSDKTAEYLHLTLPKVAEFRDAGFLKEEMNVPAPPKRGRGRYFLRSTVMAFAESEEYALLKPRGKRRATATTTVTVTPESLSPITGVKVLLYRGDKAAEEVTLEALAQLVVNALIPMIGAQVQESMREYFKNVQW